MLNIFDKNRNISPRDEILTQSFLINQIANDMKVKYKKVFSLINYDEYSLKNDINSLLAKYISNKHQEINIKYIETNILNKVREKYRGFKKPLNIVNKKLIKIIYPSHNKYNSYLNLNKKAKTISAQKNTRHLAPIKNNSINKINEIDEKFEQKYYTNENLDYNLEKNIEEDNKKRNDEEIQTQSNDDKLKKNIMEEKDEVIKLEKYQEDLQKQINEINKEIENHNQKGNIKEKINYENQESLNKELIKNENNKNEINQEYVKDNNNEIKDANIIEIKNENNTNPLLTYEQQKYLERKKRIEEDFYNKQNRYIFLKPRHYKKEDEEKINNNSSKSSNNIYNYDNIKINKYSMHKLNDFNKIKEKIRLEKIISLPIIQFNFNGGINIDKYKINLFNKKNNYNIKNKRTDKVQSFKKLVTFGKEINYKIPKLPIYLTSGIDIDSLFDFQNFNIFNLRDKIGLENVMPFLGKEIIKKINILHFFDEQKLENFLMVLSKTYQNTRALYHTSLHGVDVCYSTFLILTFLRNEENKIKDISDIDIVSLIIAALAHDVGHPGYTNKFLINSKNELSTIYNDASVLENFHSAKTFQLLENNEINIFSNFSNEDFLLIRKKMIGEILSTDMSFHFKIVNEYKEYKKNKDKVLEQNQLNFITHIADLFHNYRKYEISLRWVELLSNEFWNQGDKERELGLPISFLCDREDINVPKSQVDFIHTFSLPTIQELVDVNIKFEVLKNNVINNLNMWDKLQKEKRKRGWTPKKSDKNTL